MLFQVSFDYRPCPSEPDGYLCPFTVDVLCWNADTDEHVLGGRIKGYDLDIFRVLGIGRGIWDVFDAHSGDLEYVGTTLLTDDGELREEVSDDFVSRLMLIDDVCLHPMLHPCERFILDQVSTLFSEASVLVLWKSQTLVSEKDLAQMGFQKIADADAIFFRLNMNKQKYGASQDRAIAEDIELPPDAATYIEDLWRQKFLH